MMYTHKKATPPPLKIESLNLEQDKPLNRLEVALICLQKMLVKQAKEGKKGIAISNKQGEVVERMTFKELQAYLYLLDTYFGLRGAFSFGICANCEHFKNSGFMDGCQGYCKNVAEQPKSMLDSCEGHTGPGGFGKDG